jgi:hypothetical protein
MHGFPPAINDKYAPSHMTYERVITYGPTPVQNDTVYTTRFVGSPMPELKQKAKQVFNREYYK